MSLTLPAELADSVFEIFRPHVSFILHAYRSLFMSKGSTCSIATLLAICILYPLHFCTVKQQTVEDDNMYQIQLPFYYLGKEGFGAYDGLIPHAFQKSFGIFLFRYFELLFIRFFQLGDMSYLASTLVAFMASGLANSILMPLAVFNVSIISKKVPISYYFSTWGSFCSLWGAWRSSLFVVFGHALNHLLIKAWHEKVDVIKLARISTESMKNLVRSIEHGVAKFLSLTLTFPFTLLRTREIHDATVGAGNNSGKNPSSSSSVNSSKEEDPEMYGFALLYCFFEKHGFSGLYTGFWMKAIEHVLVASLTKAIQKNIRIKDKPTSTTSPGDKKNSEKLFLDQQKKFLSPILPVAAERSVKLHIQ